MKLFKKFFDFIRASKFIKLINLLGSRVEFKRLLGLFQFKKSRNNHVEKPIEVLLPDIDCAIVEDEDKNKVLIDVEKNVVISKEDFEYFVQLVDIVFELNNQLTGLIMNSSQNNDSIASESSSVSVNISEQSNKLQDIHSNLMNMVTNIVGISKSSDNITHSTADTSNIIFDGSKIVKELVDQMKVVTNVVNEVSSLVISLKQRSSEIQTIIDTIKEIATQTNLLSLNAAIESARVGELGKGFSVVASEIRKLSVQSSTASGDIIKQINDIMEEAESTYQKMKESSLQVEKTFSMTEKVDKVFDDILKSISNINAGMQEISTSTQENSNASQNILSSLDVVAEKSKDNSESAKNVSRFSEHQTASIIEIVTLSQQISDLISDFKQKLENINN